jgi:hypothetical protein
VADDVTVAADDLEVVAGVVRPVPVDVVDEQEKPASFPAPGAPVDVDEVTVAGDPRPLMRRLEVRAVARQALAGVLAGPRTEREVRAAPGRLAGGSLEPRTAPPAPERDPAETRQPGAIAAAVNLAAPLASNERCLAVAARRPFPSRRRPFSMKKRSGKENLSTRA